MGHDLATKTNGQTALWLNGEPAWHNLGTVWDETKQGRAPIATVLEHSGLDYTLELWPMFYGNSIESKMGTNPVTEGKRWAVVRTDTNTQIGTVGDGYKIFQPREAFGFLDELVGGVDGARWETAGELMHGARMFVSVRLGQDIVLDGQGAADRIQRFLFATQFNNGRGSMTLALGGVRPVCANTLSWGLDKAEALYRIQHRTGGLDKIAEAADALKLSNHYFDQFEQDANKLIKTRMTAAQFSKFLTEVAFPEAKDESDLQKRRRQEKIARAMFLFQEAKTQENIRDTRWGAANALAEQLDHPELDSIKAPKSLLLDAATPKTLQAQIAKGARVVSGDDLDRKTKLHAQLLTWKTR